MMPNQMKMSPRSLGNPTNNRILEGGSLFFCSAWRCDGQGGDVVTLLVGGVADTWLPELLQTLANHVPLTVPLDGGGTTAVNPHICQ